MPPLGGRMELDMTHKGTVTLETERLILRRLTLNDADAMFRNWCNDPEATKYLMWPAHSDVAVTERVLNEWIPLYDKPDYYHWAIVPLDSGEPIGTIAAVRQSDDDRMVHIGYCSGKAWWRRGYMSEALNAVVKFFFEEVGMNRVESRHDPRNPNSGIVMQKAGLRYEGTARQSDHNNQGACDAANYAILAEDYFREKSSLVGKTATVTEIVNETDAARAVGSGSLDVFATPMMIALMERAACECLADTLTDGQTSVGTQISIEHTAASPIGAEVNATATITAVDGRKIEFGATASDGAGEIGRGTHTRAIVDSERFMAKAGTRK
jgi:ribosomal-protein-alanine N-acetyltransferase